MPKIFIKSLEGNALVDDSHLLFYSKKTKPAHLWRMLRASNQSLIWSETMTRICSIEDCDKPSRKRGWCNMHYTRFVRHGNPLKTLTAPDGAAIEFIKNAAESDTNDCIDWPYAKTDGYGLLFYDGKRTLATRLCLILSKSTPPTPQHVAAHLPVICHNTACINPRHLRWATHKENMNDKAADKTKIYGESVSTSKLTKEQVISIRKDTRLIADIAKDYGIHKSNVSLIKRGKRWGWVKENNC